MFQWLEQIGGDDAHPKFATRRENRNGAVSVACSIDLTQDFTTISNESFGINVRLNRGDWRIIVDGDSADSVKDLFKPRVDGVVQIDINFGPLRFFPLINMLCEYPSFLHPFLYEFADAELQYLGRMSLTSTPRLAFVSPEMSLWSGIL